MAEIKHGNGKYPGRARTPWTIEDVRYLETHYGVKKTREIATYLNRNMTAVRATW